MKNSDYTIPACVPLVYNRIDVRLFRRGDRRERFSRQPSYNGWLIPWHATNNRSEFYLPTGKLICHSSIA